MTPWWPIWDENQPLTPVERVDENGERVQIAEGFEQTVHLTTTVEGKSVTWVERRLVVRSLAQAHAAETALRARLDKAELALKALNERH